MENNVAHTFSHLLQCIAHHPGLPVNVVIWYDACMTMLSHNIEMEGGGCLYRENFIILH